ILGPPWEGGGAVMAAGRCARDHARGPRGRFLPGLGPAARRGGGPFSSCAMIGRMGASLGDLRTILQLRRDGLLPARFSVAEIGAQQLSNEVLRDPHIMRAYAEAFGVEPRTFG